MADRTYIKVGDVISGRWEVVKPIGEGGMSNVYLILDRKMQRTLALKEVPIKRTPEGLAEVQAVKEEITLLKSLSYPSIPKIIDMHETDKALNIVMEFVNGISLHKVILDRKYIEEKYIIRWGIALAKTLRYLHNHRYPVIYRDMKPHNVMLTENDEIVLLDFGISVEMRPNVDSSKMPTLGTDGYAAPEQSSATPWFDGRSDIHALGRTLFYLATATSPTLISRKNRTWLRDRRKAVASDKFKILVGMKYQGVPLSTIPKEELKPLKVKALEDATAEVHPRKFPSIRYYDKTRSRGLELIIERATARSPKERYQTIEEMIYDLENIGDLSKEHVSTVNKRYNFILFSCAGLLAGVSLLGAGYGYQVIDSSHRYNTDLQSGVTNQDPALLLKASAIRPESLKPYFGLVDIYKQDSEFTLQEEAQLLGQLQPNLSRVKEQKGAGNLLYDIAKLYWFYYTDSGQVKAVSWLEQAKSLEVSGSDKEMLNLYLELGTFQKNILSSITSESDNGMYVKYWKALSSLPSTKDFSDKENVKLTYMSGVYDVIDSYSGGLKDDGVSRDDLLVQFDKVNQLLKSGDFRKESSQSIVNNLKERTETVKNKLNTTYGVR